MDNSIAVAMELCEGLGARNGGELLRVVVLENRHGSDLARRNRVPRGLIQPIFKCIAWQSFIHA
jgi:hypothetical protein